MGEHERLNAEAGMEFLTQMDEMLDLLDGYRARLVSRGYTEHAAEQMAVHMHETMMKNIVSQL